MIDMDDYMKYGIVHDEDEDNYDDYVYDYDDSDDELDRLINDDGETNDNDEENDSEDYLYDDSNVKSRSNSNEYRPMKSDRKTVKTEIVFDPYDYVDDDTEELYYTKMLLDNFPELKNEFSIDNWNVPLFMIKDLTERQDFDSALKYFQFLVNNVDYDYLFKKKRETADRLSIEIYYYIFSGLYGDEERKNDHKVAEFFLKNTKLFDVCFKKCDWKAWGQRLSGVLSNYMGLFEEIGNLEHEKKAYDTFVKYHKDIATIENMAFFWQLYFKGNLKFDDALYDFYKERIIPLGEKGETAMFNLDYTKKHKDEMLITYRSEVTPEEKRKYGYIARDVRWSKK